MHLPPHVYDLARQEHLIAKDKLAIIRIETEKGRLADNYKYEINNYSYAEFITSYLQGEWEEFDRFFRIKDRTQSSGGGVAAQESVVYSRAEHQGDPKLPDIAVLPNLATEETRGLSRPLWLLGSTMGHYLPAKNESYRIQEVIEFQSYGMLVLDREDNKVEIWIAQEGDKVSVPNGCHVTLYNLGDENNPLVTLSFYDPNRNLFNQDLVSNCGPILLGYYDDFEVVFTLNRLYINNPTHSAGVQLSEEFRESQERQVRISRSARLDLGRLLHEQFTQNPEVIAKFARLGISIKPASRGAVLEPYPPDRDSRLYFSSPLAEIVQKGTDVYRFFIQDCEPDKPPRSSSEKLPSFKEEDEHAAEQIEKRVSQTLGRPLVIIVEGVGDWVEHTYRKLFNAKVGPDEPKLSVFYADDTRWKAQPEWSKPETGNLKPWEVYLDKANPEHFVRYQNLLPDTVFVVTPDFTHSNIARDWLNRAAMIFVEKPFDSQVRNVEHLRFHIEQRTKTHIFGLDHYQFYALPVHDMLGLIYKHLGGSLAKVEFYLTEGRPLESDRVKSLQYGLTLDLLPHLVALLTYFGDISTIDEIVVEEAGQYLPLKSLSRDGAKQEDWEDRYQSETYSRIRFTFLDKSEHIFRIPCSAVVGKGFTSDVKYLEITGVNGNSVRVDLNEKPLHVKTDYPFNSVFLIRNAANAALSITRKVVDPYQPNRTLEILRDESPKKEYFVRELKRERYYLLLDDLLEGTKDSVVGPFSLSRGQEIVRTLDRVWWAIQASRSWVRYPLQKQDPFTKVGQQVNRPGEGRSQPQRREQTRKTGMNLVLPRRSSGLVARGREDMEEGTAFVRSRGPLLSEMPVAEESHLSSLVTTIREQVRELPLTIVIHGWETVYAVAFLSLLRPSPRDAVWVVPAKPVSRPGSGDIDDAIPVSPAKESAVFLDLTSNIDQRIYQNLIADLVYFPALDEAESQQITSFKRRARAFVVDKRNSQHDLVVAEGRKTSVPLYLWSGQPSIEAVNRTGDIGAVEDLGDPLASSELDLIGKMLKDTAIDFAKQYRRRIDFRDRILNVIDRYPGRPSWNADLVWQAHIHEWPIWAVQCLPAMYVIVEALSDGEIRALVWKYIVECLPKSDSFNIESQLCSGEILQVVLPEKTVPLVEQISRLFEDQMRNNPYPSERSFIGAINNALQDVEILLKAFDESAADHVLKLRGKVLQSQNVIPNPLPESD